MSGYRRHQTVVDVLLLRAATRWRQQRQHRTVRTDDGRVFKEAYVTRRNVWRAGLVVFGIFLWAAYAHPGDLLFAAAVAAVITAAVLKARLRGDEQRHQAAEMAAAGRADAVEWTLRRAVAGVVAGARAEQIGVGVKWVPGRPPALASIQSVGFTLPAGANVHDPDLPGRLTPVLAHWLAHWPAVRLEQIGPATFEAAPGERTPAIPNTIPRPAGRPTAGVFPIGVDLAGRRCDWQPHGIAPHLLVCGETGSGKTVVLRNVGLTAIETGVETVVIDPKRRSLLELRGCPHIADVATELDTMANAIGRVYNQLERRNAAYEQAVMAGQEPPDEPMLLLVCDELSELFLRFRKAHTGKGEPDPLTQFQSLIFLGREANVHLCVGLQRPDAEFIGGAARSNFGLMVGLGSIDRHGMTMIGATIEPAVVAAGRGVAVEGNRERELQCFDCPKTLITPWRPPAAVTADAEERLLSVETALHQPMNEPMNADEQPMNEPMNADEQPMNEPMNADEQPMKVADSHGVTRITPYGKDRVRELKGKGLSHADVSTLTGLSAGTITNILKEPT